MPYLCVIKRNEAEGKIQNKMMLFGISVNVKNYQIKPNTPSRYGELVSLIEEKSMNIWGFGQDYHSEEGTPTYTVHKFTKENAIYFEDNPYLSVSVDHNRNEIYLQNSYAEGKYNAVEYDKRGKGFKVK